MRMRLLVLFAVFGAVLGQEALPNFIGKVAFPTFPAFLELYEDENPVDPVMSKTLYISSFNPLNLFDFDPVFYLRGPGLFVREPEALVSNLLVEELGNNWANNPDRLPSAAVGHEGVIWTSGFLVPGKTHGRLNMYFTDQGGFEGPYNIASLDEMDWSYHRVEWRDIDNDDDLDCITARFHTDLIGRVTTDFSWLENPGSGVYEGWQQHFISSEGPDVHFKSVELAGPDGTTLLGYVAGEFWAEKIGLWYTEDNDWGSINIEYNVKRVNVDDTGPGQVFDVYVDDFNRDGVMDLLATVYNVETELGYVYAYEIPQDTTWMEGNWKRHVIASNFVANPIFGGASMTPGSPKTFYPSVEYENTRTRDGRQLKPYISLSGDDDGKLYIITADSEAADDWTYTTHLLIDSNGTTSGKLAIGDMDNDGYTDIIAAGYTVAELYFFTYASLDE